MTTKRTNLVRIALIAAVVSVLTLAGLSALGAVRPADGATEYNPPAVVQSHPTYDAELVADWGTDLASGNVTVVVAAQDSALKEAADFVCDGVADEEEIQRAMDLLSDGGGEVLLLPGDYHLSGGADYCLELHSNVTLKGKREDPARIKLVGQPAKGIFITQGWRWNPPCVNVENVSLRNLVIDAGSPGGFWREGEWGNHWDFLVICGSIDYLSVENLRFTCTNPETVTSRLFLWQCDHVRILNSTFEGVAIWLFSHTDNRDPSSITGGDTVIEGCSFLNTCNKMAVGANMRGLTVRRNEFRDCRNTAIDVGISPNALVEENTIMGAVGNGIYGEGGYGQVFRNNVIDGVLADEPGGWNGFGIAVRDNLHMRLGEDVLIERNNITNCGNGIAAMGVPDVRITGNTLAGIDARGIQVGCVVDEGLYYDGIPSFGDHCLVAGNTIVDFGRATGFGRGVLLIDVLDCEVRDNLVDGCDNVGAVCGVEELRWHERHGDELSSQVFWGRPNTNIIENNSIAGVSELARVTGQGTVYSEPADG